jgi:hypothetical protein
MRDHNPQSRIEALFTAWNAEGAKPAATDADLNAKTAALAGIEDELMRIPAANAREVYLQIIVADAGGDMGFSTAATSLAALAHRVAR